MIYNIFNYLTGYVKIKIDGVGLEKVLNNYGVTFWDVKRQRYTQMTACVTLLSYYKLLKKAKGVSITVISEHGLYTVFKNIWKNKIIFFGLLFNILLLCFLSNLVLHINISGNITIDQRDIKQYVLDSGIRLGSFRWQNDLDKTIAYLESRDDIAFASCGYDGVTVNVIIIESKLSTDKSPSNIIASHTSVITKIDVFSGTKQRQIGDIIQKGDLLVSGLKLNEQGEIEKIQSRANIEGAIWLEGSSTQEIAESIGTRTQNNKKQKYIDFWGNTVIISNEEIEFEYYEVEIKENFIGKILPIKYYEKIAYELEVSNQDKDISKLLEKNDILAFENAVQDVPKNAKIVNIDTKYYVENGKLTTKVLVEAHVPIGINSPLE